MMKLAESNVRFDKAAHVYHLDDVILQGITSSLVRRAYPHTYDCPSNLTDEQWRGILSNAAARGTAVHEALELYEDVGVKQDMPELLQWITFKDEYGLAGVEAEYIVTDGEHYATAIDHVMEDGDGNAVLVDIKTTASLHVPEVTLQLNICRRFFERQNPDVKVSAMYAVWLRGDKAQYVRCGSIGEELIGALIDADINDKPFDSMALFGSLPVEFASVEDEIVKLKKEMDVAKKRYNELSQGLLSLMNENNVKSFTGNRVKLTRKLATTRKGFDEKQFREDYPDIYEKYITESEVKESIVITVK